MRKRVKIRPVLSIIIVNYNTKELLKQCLDSIFKNDKRLSFLSSASDLSGKEKIPAEIIVVDNGSEDGSREFLREIKRNNAPAGLKYARFASEICGKAAKYAAFGGEIHRNMPLWGEICSLRERNMPAGAGEIDRNNTSSELKQDVSFKVVFNNKNLGFAKANNQGMRIAEGEYLLLLNSDTIIKDSAISQSLLWLSAHPEFDLVGCRLLNPDGSVQPSVGKFPTLFNVFLMLFFDRLLGGKSMSSPQKVERVDWVMGAFMMLRRDLFRKTGGFDERIFMYMEEVEWCYRIKKQGMVVGFYPGAKIIHIGGGSLGGKRHLPIVNIYKGLVYFYQKHKGVISFFLLRIMLKSKAALLFILGSLFGNEYLEKTYKDALAVC